MITSRLYQGPEPTEDTSPVTLSVNSTGLEEKEAMLEESTGQLNPEQPSSPPTIIENVESVAPEVTLVGGGSGENEGEEEGNRKASSPIPDTAPKTSTPDIQRNPQSSPHRRFACEMKYMLFCLLVSLGYLFAHSRDPSPVPSNSSEGSEASAKAQAPDCHVNEKVNEGELHQSLVVTLMICVMFAGNGGSGQWIQDGCGQICWHDGVCPWGVDWGGNGSAVWYVISPLACTITLAVR